MRPYLEEMGIDDLLVAAGSAASEGYPGRGIPRAALIDPQDMVVWEGHPMDLSKGMIKGALKGASRPPASQMLAFRPAEKRDGLDSIEDQLAAGELSRAYASLDGAVGAGTAGAAELRAEVDAFVASLREQIESAVTRKQIAVALDAYEVLAKDLSAREAGAEIRARIQAIEKDKDLMAERDAADALDKAHAVAEKRGAKKAANNYESVVKKYPGTKAAKRAQDILDKLK